MTGAAALWVEVTAEVDGAAVVAPAVAAVMAEVVVGGRGEAAEDRGAEDGRRRQAVAHARHAAHAGVTFAGRVR